MIFLVRLTTACWPGAHLLIDDEDVVYFAYCYPLTYTDLQLYLKRLEDDPCIRGRFRRRSLCQSLAGNTYACVNVNLQGRISEL